MQTCTVATLVVGLLLSSIARVSPQTLEIPQKGVRAAWKSYVTNCVVCHDTTGKGNPMIRRAMSELPDFTDAQWQKSRTDQDLAQSILVGKGRFHPAMAERLKDVDVKEMVGLVRAFHSKSSVKNVSVKGTGKPSEKKVIMSLYNRYCIRCHGVDGRGVWDIPKVPNFTDPRWQASRSDAEVIRAILEGRGGAPERGLDCLKLAPPSKATGTLDWVVMPPFRGRLTPEEAQGMTRFLRTFAPSPETPEDTKKKPAK
jgi:mono/diheme cytochrome c family protein